MKQRILLVIIISLLLTPKKALSGFPGTFWETSTPEAQGISSAKLQAAMDFMALKGDTSGNRRMLVIRNGYVIWAGPLVSWPASVGSTSKVFLGTALGLLIQDGKCTLETLAKDFDPSLAQYYPTVTLRHFTTMTSGYDSVGGEYAFDPQWRGDANALRNPAPPIAPPGAQFRYSDEAGMRFGYVLSQIAGESIERYIYRRIMVPIGITGAYWYQLPASHGGVPNWVGGLVISANELARLAWFAQNGGVWNGTPILNSGWFAEATKVQVPNTVFADKSFDSRNWAPGVFGYNWWVNGRTREGFRPWSGAVGTYWAPGTSGNVVFSIPVWNMVIAKTGDDPVGVNFEAWSGTIQKIKEAFLTFVPLPKPAAPTITSPTPGQVLDGARAMATLSWTAVPGAAEYLLRVTDLTDPNARDSRTLGGNFYLLYDEYHATSIDLPVRPGHSYRFWLHAANSNFSYAAPETFSTAASVDFSVGVSSNVAPPVLPGPQPTNSSPTPGAETGLQGSWSLDSTTIVDLSGRGQNSTASGAITVPGFNGSGTALFFDGLNGYAELPLQLATQAQVTLSAWIKPASSTAQNGTIFYAGGYQGGFGLVQNDGGCGPGSKLSLLLETLTCSGATPAPTLPINVWSHVALTKNGSLFIIYLNGVEVARGSGNPRADQGPLSIGAKRATNGQIYNRFKGAIDELRYYSRPLSAQEIGQLASIRPVEFVGAWSFDETSGTTLLDRSGNQKNGVLLNNVSRVPGKTGNGLLFDGVDDYATFPVTVDATRDLTLTLWARPDVSSLQNGTIAYAGASSDGFGLVVSGGACNNGNQLAVLFEQITCNAVNAAPVLPIGTWSHVAIVRSGNEWRTYLGGRLSGRTTLQPRLPSSGLKIGAQIFGNGLGNKFKGALDDLRLYNRALSEAELTALTMAP